MPVSRLHAALCVGAFALAPLAASAQVTVKPDGQFRYVLGAGASYASGNTSSRSINLNGEAVRATADDKIWFGAKGLYGRTDGTTTAERFGLGGQYDRNLANDWFAFGRADALRDKLANISSETSLFVGGGRHLVKRDDLTFDVGAGLGYTYDRYDNSVWLHDQNRTSYGRLEALLFEESTHKWTDTTTFHQKLSVYPSLRSGGGWRGVFDSGIAVAMSKSMSLTAGLNYRYNSDPGYGYKKGDTLFVTGIAVKVD